MSNGQNSSAPVELLVTNLDQTVEPQELKSMLLSMFQEHVMVCTEVILFSLAYDTHISM